MPLCIHSVHNFIWYFHHLLFCYIAPELLPQNCVVVWQIWNSCTCTFMSDYCLVFFSSVVHLLTVYVPLLLFLHPFPAISCTDSVSIFKPLPQFSHKERKKSLIWRASIPWTLFCLSFSLLVHFAILGEIWEQTTPAIICPKALFMVKCSLPLWCLVNADLEERLDGIKE